MHTLSLSQLQALTFNPRDALARRGLLAAHEAVFGGQPDEHWLDWKFVEGRGVGCGLWTAPPTEGGELAAFCGGLPRTMFQGARAVPALQIGDVMVRPAWRGAARRGGAFYRVSDAMYRAHLGADRAQAWGYGFPSHRHLRLAVKLGLLHDAGPMVGAVWGSAGVPSEGDWGWGWRLERLGTVDEALKGNALATTWAAMKGQAGAWVVGDRSPEWMHWRYRHRASQGRAAVLWQVRRAWRRRPEGVVVLRALDAGARPAAMWLDWIGPPTRLPWGLRAAQRAAALMDCVEIHAWMSQGPWAQLQGSGHLAQHEVARIGVPSASLLSAEQSAALPWWFMGGDTDFL